MSFLEDDDGDFGTPSLFDSPEDRFLLGGLLAAKAANDANKRAERRNQEQLEKLDKIAVTEAEKVALEKQRVQLEQERLALDKAHREGEKRAHEALLNLKRTLVEIKMELEKARSNLHENSCDLFSPSAGSIAFIGTQIEFLEKEKEQLTEIADIEMAAKVIAGYKETSEFFSNNSKIQRDPLTHGRELGQHIAAIQANFTRISGLIRLLSQQLPDHIDETAKTVTDTVRVLTSKIADLIKENPLGPSYGSGWMIKLYIAEHGTFPDWATGTSETIKANIEDLLKDSLDKLFQAKATAQKRLEEEKRVLEEKTEEEKRRRAKQAAWEKLNRESKLESATTKFKLAKKLFDSGRSNLSLKTLRKARAVYLEAEAAAIASQSMSIPGRKEASDSKNLAESRFRKIRNGAIFFGLILTLSLFSYFKFEAGQKAAFEAAALAELMAAKADVEFTNGLGMRFVYIPGLSGVLFCEHETRVKDYAAFMPRSSKREKDDYPMVNVTWEEANAFCAWLSRKEGRNYRLPTKREWLIAYDGDHGGELYRRGRREAKGGPSFQNPNGLYHMRWNVSEWCEDRATSDREKRVAIGGSYAIMGSGNDIPVDESFCPKTDRSQYIGFRLVVDVDR